MTDHANPHKGGSTPGNRNDANCQRWQIAETLMELGTIEWDLQNGQLSLSGQIKQTLGFEVHENPLSDDLFMMVHPEDREMYRDTLDSRFISRPGVQTYISFKTPVEYRLNNKNGKLLYLKEYGVVYYNEGEAVKYVSVLVDETATQRSLIKLDQQKKNFSDLVSALKSSFLVLRGVNKQDGVFQDFVILNTNQAFLDSVGKNYDDVFEKTIRKILPSLPREFFRHASETINKGQSAEDEIFLADTGRYVNITFQKIKHVKLFLILEDVTDKRAMQNTIINSIIHTEENVRSRIARELHDGLGPLLSTLKMYIEKYTQTGKPELKSKLEPQLMSILDDAISNVSAISNNLSPQVLKSFGLNKALARFIRHVEAASNCRFEFEMDTDQRFPEKIEITLYRVLTELINNSLKYSEPGLITINVGFQSELFTIQYEDDGKSFDYDAELEKRTGQGLFNMKSRLESMNGKIDYLGGENEGVKYHIELPVNDITI